MNRTYAVWACVDLFLFVKRDRVIGPAALPQLEDNIEVLWCVVQQ